ncbi:XRE family transcriptional regulator [Enterococcus faecalis]|uniref:XRE family transcriptional regulator n=1 Tax=Enterococcus faecalis TaxID=1351 RepID=A0A974S6P1_ENTFL|nr:XRE family transcriptional regulator [Enterococcus faecalis]
MDVLGALKIFLEKKKNCSEKMFCQKGKQTYRRIEIGEAKLSYEDLMTALQSLGDYFLMNFLWYLIRESWLLQKSNIKLNVVKWG